MSDIVKGLTLIGWLPLEFVPFLVVGGGLLLIVGARRMAGVLLASTLGMIFLPPVIEPFLGMLPLWALLGLGMLVLVFTWRDLKSIFGGGDDKEKQGSSKAGRLGTRLIIWAMLGFLAYLWLIQRGAS